MAALDVGGSIPLRDPRDGKVVGHEAAERIFDAVCRAAWRNGDPGLVFLDRINAANPTPNVGQYEGTNPCGEQPLLAHESCNLGSINVERFVRGNGIDFEALGGCVHEAVRFLDDVIEVSRFPISQIDRITRANRKVGLGVMGFADLLVRLGVSYAEPAAVAVAEELMAFIQKEAHAASEALADERGAFANLAGSIYEHAARPPRNSTVTTIAPTGTISLIADCSSGIEPYFALCYWRRALEDERLLVVSPLFERMTREAGVFSEALIERVAAAGSVADLAEVPDDLKRLFVTARDVPVACHVAIQAAFQRHTDNAVSKTVNLPAAASVADVREAYLLAWRAGCKGITIYRDRSRARQVLNVGAATAASGESEVSCPKCHAPMQRSGNCLLCHACGFGYCR
jgi:ribonucleoside-diphosphate reductase alpha chain